MKMIHKILLAIIVLLIATITNASAIDGKNIYDKNCGSCHDTGTGGAPRFGNKPEWKDRLESGINNMEQSVIKGVQGYGGSMPPRGGNPDLTDAEIKAAVAYMVKSIQ